jgi:hypothetical protein
MHARERETREIERVAVLFVDGAQGFLAGDLVAQIEFAQRVFLDVAEDAHGITDLAEFGIKKGGQAKQALEAGDVGGELRAHILLDGLDDHVPAILEPGAMHLADGGGRERGWFDAFKVVKESGNGGRA